MSDVYGRQAELALQPLQLEAHRLAELGVKVRQRLVQQQELRFGDQRPRERQPLLLATGQLGRLPLGELGEPDRLQHAQDSLAQLGPAQALPARHHLQRERDVAEHSHVRPDRVALEHHAEPTPVGRHVDALVVVEQHALAQADDPGVGPLQAGDRAQRGGLAAARRAEQGEQRTLLDLEAHAVDGVLRLLPSTGPLLPEHPRAAPRPVALDKSLHGQHRHPLSVSWPVRAAQALLGGRGGSELPPHGSGTGMRARSLEGIRLTATNRPRRNARPGGRRRGPAAPGWPPCTRRWRPAW